MTIRNGVVYSQWSSGILSATDLYTGTVLRQVEGVAFATAPFIVGNRIYSYNHRVGELHELDLDTFERIRLIPIVGGGYSESLPYDAETGLVFVWRWTSDNQGFFSAVRLEDGLDAWTSEFSLGKGSLNTGSPVLPGDDSVYVQAADGHNRVYRFDKATGALRWKTTLSPGDLVDYNNMVYDRAHDVFYVSTVDARLFAVRRTDGAILWSQAFPFHEIHATLSYHDGYVYVPLFGRLVQGAYASVNATNGIPLWVRLGFFGEDGWSANAVDDRYLYRNTHSGEGRIIVQDRFTSRLVWSGDAGAGQPCTNPVQSDGIVVFGNAVYLIAIQVGTGLPVDCSWHGVNATGYNPGAIVWDDPPPNPDVDGDRLPDVWEMSVFDHLFSSSDDDPDGDRSTNFEEYLAGSSCVQADDNLRLRVLSNRGSPVLTFTTRKATGIAYRGLRRLYAVEWALTVASQDWLPLAGAARIPAIGKTASISLTPSQVGRFYRVRAWLEPH